MKFKFGAACAFPKGYVQLTGTSLSDADALEPVKEEDNPCSVKSSAHWFHLYELL